MAGGHSSPDDKNELVRIDTTRPHQARVWNVLLGGKDNYPPDREFAERVTAIYPSMVDIARHSRAFLGRAVRHLAGEAGIVQYLDIGTGLPTHDNTHEVAQRIAPESRVVYVDNDPLVLVHAQALLTNVTREGACDYIEADVRDPDNIIEAAARTLDFTRPTALMLLGVMGTIDDDDLAYGIVRHLLGALPPGSYLVFEDGTSILHPEAAATFAEVRDDMDSYGYRLRRLDQIEPFFDGLELLEPGVVSVSRWRVEDSPWGVPDEVDAFCGVGRKP